MTTLITPSRAKELKRAAAHHAGMLIITALRAGFDPDNYFPDDAERDLVLEEIGHIGEEIKARAVVGTHRRCAECDRLYTIKGDGTIRRHFGITQSGFSTGDPCPGADKPPRPAASA